MRLGGLLLASILAAALVGCGDYLGTDKKDPPLPGERVPVLTFDRGIKPDPQIGSLDVRLPRPMPNSEWPQAGGYPNHAMHHLAAGGELQQSWRTAIGEGSDSEVQLIGQPIVSHGTVFTIDVRATVRAFEAATGKRKWQRDLAPDEDDEGTLGGGVAINGERLYVTTGFAQVIALDAADGKEIWRKPVPSPVRAPPAVYGGRLFVVTIANELFVLAADDGRSIWNHAGLTEVAGLVGGSPPAVEGEVVVTPYSSGEVVALRVENGRVIWSDTLSALRRTDPVSSLAHVRGVPVIDRDLVFVVSHSGRTVAIDLRTGARIWEQPVGGTQGPWVAGDFVYVLGSTGELVCFARRDGRVRWVHTLQRFENEKSKKGPILWTGPALVGDRLIVANNKREVWSISPYNGEPMGKIKISGPVLIPPAVADETVYLLTEDADLIALR
jgi:outer membrane protein assembly factor BamB